MKNITEILASVEETPSTFEDYLKAYADPVGELINGYIPHGAHGDMDRYLYDPLYHYSENAGKRHRPLICFAACLAVGGDPNRAATAAAASCLASLRSFMQIASFFPSYFYGGVCITVP